MSRYDFRQSGYLVELGWDEALQTFFVQVFAETAEDEPPLLWVGTRLAEIREVSIVDGILTKFGLDLPDDIRGELQEDDKTVSEPRGRSWRQLRELGFDTKSYPCRAEGFPQGKRSAVLVEKMWDNGRSLACFFIDLESSSKFRVWAQSKGGGYGFAGSDLDASLLRRGSVLELELGTTKGGYLKVCNPSLLGIHPAVGDLPEIIR